MLQKLLFSIYILYCFEVGLFLLIFPWIGLWYQNSLLSHYPVLRVVLLNNFFRGAVSGLGIANLILGIWEITRYRYYFKKV